LFGGQKNSLLRQQAVLARRAGEAVPEGQTLT